MKRWARIGLALVALLAIFPLVNLGHPFQGASESNVPSANAFSRGDHVKVSESVSVVVNGKQYAIQKNADNSRIRDFDRLSITASNDNANSIAIMDKIFNSERLRFNGKTLVAYDPMSEPTGEKTSAAGNKLAMSGYGYTENSGQGQVGEGDLISPMFSSLDSTLVSFWEVHVPGNNSQEPHIIG